MLIRGTNQIAMDINVPTIQLFNNIIWITINAKMLYVDFING